MKKYLFVIILSVSSCFSQEQFGLLHSNYLPSITTLYNPSTVLDSKTWLDIHIVGIGSYLNNNFVSLKNNSFYSIYKTDGSNISEDDLDYNSNRRNIQAYNRTFVNVLSATWSQGDFGAGLFFNARSFTHARGIPEFVGNFIENGVPNYTEQHNIDYKLKNVYASSIAFGEVQASFAYTFYKKQRNMMMAGISIKKFFSGAGGALNLYNFEFNVNSDTLTSVFNLQADAMATTNPEFYVKAGIGFDLGFTYQKMLSDCSSYKPNSKKNGCKQQFYKYSLSAALIDLGSIKFAPNSVQFAGYDFDLYDWFNYANTEVDEDDPTNLFENQESDINSGTVKKTDRIVLPRALHLSGDYNVWASRFFVSGSLFQSIPISRSKFGVRRANSLAVSARFEMKWFEVSVPISLYEYYRPQLGLSLRLYCLTIGTDKLLHIFGKSDLYGGDIYFHLNVPIFYNPKCKQRMKSGTNYDPGRIKNKRKCEAYSS